MCGKKEGRVKKRARRRREGGRGGEGEKMERKQDGRCWRKESEEERES